MNRKQQFVPSSIRPLLVAGLALLSAAGSSTKASEPGTQHWAFQPVKRPALPAISSTSPHPDDKAIPSNPIDHFILAKLEANGLSLAPPASRTTLIRRVTFDLIGLPPTPEEIDSFVNDHTPDAYEKLIDRLLASPHYGERWGRHWLDLVRYAETDGFEHDAVRPHSWRYRDYVIRAFNEDKPYDQFILEQIAGDELWPEHPEALIATGFNLLGPDMVDSSDQVQRRHNTLNDMTDTTALAFLGLTLGCARCHDHKFEPFSQKDYYGLQAFFTPAIFRRDQTVATRDEGTAYAAAMKRFEENPKIRELTELEAPARERIRKAKLAKLSAEAQAAHLTPPQERNAEQANLVLETEPMLAMSETELADALTTEQRHQRKDLIQQIKNIPKPPPLPQALALGTSNGPAPKTFVLRRGEYSLPSDEIEPGFPKVLNAPNSFSSRQTGLRSALADWITSPENPLTARVMVNRIWQHHFGRGLVANPSDFGTHGQPPTHPELLDWLAAEFMRPNESSNHLTASSAAPASAVKPWSIKHIHRLILTSATYRQGTAASLNPDARKAGLSRDPENQLYWRMNRQRLEGEVIRDSLLAISGQLNPQMGGPGVSPPIPQSIFKGASGWSVSKEPQDQVRRSIYIFARRNFRYPFLEVFDAPDNNLSCPVRERSTTAPQALTLLNADEVVRAAEFTARRLSKEAGSPSQLVVPLFRLILSRPPTESEANMSREFLTQSSMTELCRALFNLNDFVYVD